MNPIKIISQNIYKELSTLQVNWALGNVGDKIRIETIVSVQNYAISTEDSPFITNNNNGVIGAGWVFDPQAQFANFKIGESVVCFDQNTSIVYNKTIVDKLDDSNIQLDTAFPFVANEPATHFVISNSTPIRSIKYHYNFIENSAGASFKSIIDPTQEQVIIIKDKAANDLTVTAMEPLDGVEWQDGLDGFLTKKFDGTSTPVATIEGVAIDPGTTDGVYKSQFKIIHYTKITPYILVDQINNQLINLPPSDFELLKCWKLITQIEAAEVYTNPNFLVSEIFESTLGNTGWYNENFNTGKTNYKISNLVYTKDSDPIDAIELGESETVINFVVNNLPDAPFSNNNTKFVLGIFKVPSDPSEYQNNGNLLDVNFLYDRAKQTLGSAPVNGDNYGGDYQILKEVSASIASATRILVSAKIDMSALAISGFGESSDPRYLLFLSIQNHTLGTDNADLVTLQVDFNEFFIDNSDPTMVSIDSKFFRHPEQGLATQGDALLSAAKEDEIVAYSQFSIDNAGRETDIIILKSITAKIKAKNSVTGDEFELDSFVLPTIDPNINLTIARPFHIPVVEIRKNVIIQRRFDLDIDEKIFYSVNFPFKFRWEYWTKLTGANIAFFVSTEPQNGLNEDWHHYSLKTDWGLYYEIEVNTTKNGIHENYSQEVQFTSYDYNSNTVYDSTSIKSYDGATELVNAGDKYLLGYKDTKIIASFHHTDNSAFDLTKCVVNMLIEVFEQGGVTGQRRMSSLWVSTSDTWFKSIDSSNKTVLSLATAVGADDTVIATVNVDFNQLPKVPKFKITARLYELTVPPYTNHGLQTDDGIDIYTDGNIPIFVD